MQTAPNALMLPGWIVTSVETYEDRIEFHAELPVDVPDCPSCESKLSMGRHESRVRRVRDAPMHGKPVVIAVQVVQYRCRKCGKQATQTVPDMHPESRLTARCAAYVQRESLRSPFTWVARDVGIDEKQVRMLSGLHVKTLNATRAPIAQIRVLGIDDIYLRGLTRTILVDLEARRPIALLAGYKKVDVEDFLHLLPNKQSIEIVCMDMASHFAFAVKNKLPASKIVFDKWHVIRKALDAVNEARRQVQRHIRAEAGNDKVELLIADIDVKRLKKHYTIFLRRRFHRLNPGLPNILENYFRAWPSLKASYDLKEQFCDIWAAMSAEDAAIRITRWKRAHTFQIKRYEKDLETAKKDHRGKRNKFVHVEPDLSETFASARLAITKNRTHILNYFDEKNVGSGGARFTNAATEAINGLIKQTQRLGRGYLFENLEARVLLREPYAPLTRKPHVNKREKTKKPLLNGYLTKTGPVPANQIKRSGKERHTKCASNGCWTTVILPRKMQQVEPGIYDVAHIFRYCPPCYEARRPYAKDGVDETDKYVRQMRLGLPRRPGLGGAPATP